jgi:hypothetical protein
MNAREFWPTFAARSAAVKDRNLIIRQTAIVCVLALLLVSCDFPFSDDFTKDGYLAPGWRFFDEDSPDSYEISDGRLKITANHGQDLWGGVPLKRGAPLMLRPVPLGDYEVECVVDARWGGGVVIGDFQRHNTQVGLFVFQDSVNWLFFGFTHHSGQEGDLPEGDGLIVTLTRGDESRIEYYQDLAEDHATLKIVRSGDLWRFHYKAYGSWYEIAHQPGVYAHFGSHEVGIGVKSFQSGGIIQHGYFDDFKIER